MSVKYTPIKLGIKEECPNTVCDNTCAFFLRENPVVFIRFSKGFMALWKLLKWIVMFLKCKILIL